MGIYVPFIKMPKTCADCVFWSICDLYEGKNPYAGKDPNCPLVDRDQGQTIDINYLEPGCFYGLSQDRVFYKVNIPTNAWENAKLEELSSADVRPAVLCRNCKHYHCGWCGLLDIGMNVNDFCSHGAKLEEN